MLAKGINHTHPRPNNTTWVWVRWQVIHKWAYCSAVVYGSPHWNFETDCKTTCNTKGPDLYSMRAARERFSCSSRELSQL